MKIRQERLALDGGIVEERKQFFNVYNGNVPITQDAKPDDDEELGEEGGAQDQDDAAQLAAENKQDAAQLEEENKQDEYDSEEEHDADEERKMEIAEAERLRQFLEAERAMAREARQGRKRPRVVVRDEPLEENVQPPGTATTRSSPSLISRVISGFLG